jgi:hypothetical protein
MAPSLRERIGPWAGGALGVAAWALHQQVLAQSLHYDCALASPWVGIAGGGGALLVTVFGAMWSWRSGHDEADAPRAFIARANAIAALPFALAIVLQTLATQLLGSCQT